VTKWRASLVDQVTQGPAPRASRLVNSPVNNVLAEVKAGLPSAFLPILIRPDVRLGP